MYIDRLRELPLPLGIATRFEADVNLTSLREGFKNPDFKLTPEFEATVSELNNPDLDSLIKHGRGTLGLIKCRVSDGVSLPPNDDRAARVILDEIHLDRLALALPWKLTREEAEAFYDPIKEKYEHREQKSDYGDTVWDGVINHAISGAVTLLLITGDGAVPYWRERMGATRPSESPRGSIRATYAKDTMLPNNLVHGSESPDEVLRELTVVRSSLIAVRNLLK